MDYSLLVKGLITEAKKGLHFKGLNKLFKVLLIIGLSPLILITLINYASFYVILFFYKALSSPLDFLHKVVKNEAQEVKHATQFIIYWIAFPLIFSLYVFKAMATVMFYFVWFNLMVSTYLVTLGGVRWQPFLMEAKYDNVDVEYEVAPGELAHKIFAGLTALCIVMILLGLLIPEIFDIDYDMYDVCYFMLDFGFHVLVISLFVVNPIMFKKKEKVSETEEIELHTENIMND